MQRTPSRTLRLAAAALLVLAATAAGAAPRLVASIAPVHALVAGVAGSAAEVHLLVPGGRSPHTFALAPSDTRALARADAVFLAGGATERFLERPLRSLAADAAVVRMTRLPDANLLPARAGGRWAHAHEEHGHAQAEERIDPHLWLDPANAVAFTRAIADTLARLDPANAARYARNAARRVERLDALDERLADRLAPVAGRPFLVFHDAYQYFEARYGLAAAGSVVVDPGRPPGARRLARLRARIRRDGIRCLFVEPQFAPEIADTIAEGTPARVVTLDPLGADLAPGPGLYVELMRGLADALVECLER